MKHSQDLCFQCAYEKICGGIKRSDCETDTKATLKHLIERETKLVQGTLRSTIYDELLRSELTVISPINPKGCNTVGQVHCYRNFELSFDFKRNTNGFNFVFEIGEWFGLLLNKNGTNCRLHNKFHEIPSVNQSFNLHQWYKELSTLFLITEIIKILNVYY